MRIVFFSDAHGNQYAVKALFKQIKKEKVDLLVFGGDIFGYYYGQEEIINLLRNHKIKCLLGNHDKMFLDLIDGKIRRESLIRKYGRTYFDIEKRISDGNINFIRTLSSESFLKIDGLNIYFAHGSKKDSLNGRIYPDTDVSRCDEYRGIDFAFLGHTHHEIEKKTFDCTIINPGSIGQPRDGKGCKYVLFDTVKREYHINKVFYDLSPLIDEIKANEEGLMRDKLIEVMYRKA